MGSTQSTETFSDITGRLESRIGKIPLTGRYHRKPKLLQHDYQVIDKSLGSGYNGVVRLAVRTEGQCSTKENATSKYAVKAFKLGAIPKDKRAQFESEIEIYLAMDHPHVTRLFDVYEEEDALYLVMECMEGGELFDRIQEVKRFSERDAARAVWQMLLAINYVHSHGIVHRDLKLENFLYDAKGSDHLKLIDFGFSKIWDKNIKMCVSCGTLAYVAPEVLCKSYTSQCDMWSLGVIVFILLAGYMPFHGEEAVQTRNIKTGHYIMKPQRWNTVSKPATEFVKSLLQVDPAKRFTAEQALEHEFIVDRTSKPDDVVDSSVVDALRRFGQASKFRRCCMEMMAWSLSNTERAKVRNYFIAMDKNHKGTITLAELKQVLVDKFHIPEDETKQVFDALDSNHDEEIHYSDFLAAMVSTRIVLHDDLLRQTFKRFDTDNSGYITAGNLREVLGNTFEGEQVEQFVKEADQLKDGRISYAEFASYLRGDQIGDHGEAAATFIDKNLKLCEKDAHSKGIMRPKVSTGKQQPACCCLS